ncbi:MAG: ExeM/NucH family extracellular endonuclease, partial [Verrucomicrobiales bacterium]|nr:ExeM/NucH family extracellular endonuclease [Verrucomicrobiales bacterium]
AGGSGTASVYSYGGSGETDRALGFVGGTRVARGGLRLINDSAQTITEFTLSFVGEQWRSASSDPSNFLRCEYRISATAFDLSSGTSHTAVPALQFDAPVTAGLDSALNGNAAGNRALKSATITGISWPVGSMLVLRWADTNSVGSDDGLAIDDVVFYAPTTTPAAPTVIETKPAPSAVDVLTTSRVAVTFDQPVSAVGAWATLNGAVSGNAPITIAGGPIRYEITPAARLNPGETYTLTVHATQVTNGGGTPMAADAPLIFTTQPAITNLQVISAVQGSGNSTPLSGQVVTVRGVVTADFQGAPPALGGLYIQSLPADDDADAGTSEGLFVYDFTSSGSADVNVGDQVLITGTAGEFGSQTQLSNITSLVVEGTAGLPDWVDAVLPMATSSELEPLECMRVRLPQTLHVTSVGTSSNFAINYARQGELMLSANGTLVTPTEDIDPNDDPASGTTSTGSGNVPAITAREAQNNLNILILDDASAAIYPDPTPYLNAQGTRRCGDTVTALSGILAYAGGRYRIQPVAPVTFVDANPRPVTPPAPGGRLKVAAMNVLNYFITFGGPNDRGASDVVEFQRQKDKVIAALTALDADLLGLIEIQNTPAAVADILTALNAATAAGTYAAAADPVGGAGGDAIRTVLLYKTAKLMPIGQCYADNDIVWYTPDPLRLPLAQVFEELSTGERFIACMNHWKSKSSSGAMGADADQGDGQGAWNNLRTAQAARLNVWLQSLMTAVGDNDVLILGDLNSNGEEDPLDVLRAGGYADQSSRFQPGDYSYRLGEARGRLDHAFATSTMASQIVGAAHWHINADEPAFLDYNLESKSVAQQALNVGTPFRSSDHDPVLVGVTLSPQPTSYAMWVASIEWPVGADTTPNGDADGDGMKNLLEFAQGSDPTTPDLSHAPWVEIVGGDFRFHYRFRTTATGIFVQPEWSENLSNWDPLTDTASEGTATSVIELLRARLDRTGKDRIFGRLSVSEVP